MDPIEAINQANNFIFEKAGGFLIVLKITFFFFSSILFAFLIFLVLKTKYIRFRWLENLFEFFTYKPYGTKRILKQWKKTKARLESGLESEYKLAVIEADSALDSILKALGYLGDTLEEKLGKINTGIIANLEEIKEVHKIRDNIVHDPDYHLSLEEAKKVISVYEKAFIDLGAL